VICNLGALEGGGVVLSGRTAAMLSVRIPFPHRRAGHCGSGAMRDLLEVHALPCEPSGKPLLDGAVFGLGGGTSAYTWWF